MSKAILFLSATLLSAVMLGCSDSANPAQAPKPDVVPAELTLDSQVSRISDGRILISGTTNLPDGLKMWIEVEKGHLPRGAPKVVASDDDVTVKGGKFASAPLWLELPNTLFTKTGWPKDIKVNTRDAPFPQGKYNVHFESCFNGFWQTPEVLSALGGEGGKTLNGKILVKTDPDVIDSPKVVDYLVVLAFPPISPTATAISLVREAVLTEPGKGRSAGDVQANIDLYMSSPGLKTTTGWSATAKGSSAFDVSYGFVDGDNGEQKAVWTVNSSTKQVKYINEYAKEFSWTPNY